MLRGELTSPPVLAATVRESAALVAVRTYNVLTVLVRQNNTLCCFEKTLLAPICAYLRLSGVKAHNYIIEGYPRLCAEGLAP